MVATVEQSPSETTTTTPQHQGSSAPPTTPSSKDPKVFEENTNFMNLADEIRSVDEPSAGRLSSSAVNNSGWMDIIGFLAGKRWAAGAEAFGSHVGVSISEANS
jgi:hypothetical protein